jgi:hypothetical protein
MLYPISPPPGIFRQGTEYQAGGQVGPDGVLPPRWFNGSLTRFFGEQVGPIGGFRQRSANPVSGMARAILPWTTNASPTVRWIGIGTHTHLYVHNASGQVFDITPSGFVAGQADESVNTGFGAAAFGAQAFGVARPDTGSTTEALVWDLDVWGDNLVACAFSDGRLVQWALNTAVPAAAISGAPTGCLGTFVTEQGFQFAVAPGGNGRRLQWSDQGNNTVWTPSTTNQAGTVDLVTSGAIRKGLRLGPQALVLTDTDAHVGQYVGLPSVWAFQRVGSGCGAISKGCVVATGQQAVWWGRSGFWLFDGSAQPIECEVYDYLQNNLNPGQRSKITGFHNSQFGEAWWFYPSASSNENDSYVYWDYRRNHWNIGTLPRLCAAQAGVFKWPLAMDPSGICYEHEVGDSYGGAQPFIETGPIELGGGDQLMHCLGLIPDETAGGQVTVDFRTRPYPGGPETVLGETSLDGSGKADLRFSARQARMRITGAAATDWRFGKARLELRNGGRR